LIVLVLIVVILSASAAWRGRLAFGPRDGGDGPEQAEKIRKRSKKRRRMENDIFSSQTGEGRRRKMKGKLDGLFILIFAGLVVIVWMDDAGRCMNSPTPNTPRAWAVRHLFGLNPRRFVVWRRSGRKINIQMPVVRSSPRSTATPPRRSSSGDAHHAAWNSCLQKLAAGVRDGSFTAAFAAPC
jgi:hypothetical protein